MLSAYSKDNKMRIKEATPNIAFGVASFKGGKNLCKSHKLYMSKGCPERGRESNLLGILLISQTVSLTV